MVKNSELIGKRAPALELPSIPNGDVFKLPIGEKLCSSHVPLFLDPSSFTLILSLVSSRKHHGLHDGSMLFRDAQTQNIVFKRNPELAVVGVSGDSTAKQQSFADQYNLSYPILSDTDNKARELYGVGKSFFGLSAGRETFFIDQQGIVRGVCGKSIDVNGHVKFVEQQLAALEK